MSAGVTGQPIPAGSRAHTLGVWSLLMIPFLLVSGAAGGILGFVILNANGLEGSEPMSVQGTPGWIAFVLSTTIFMLPMMVGVVLGLKARRLGERRLGTAAAVIDAVILVGFLTIAWVNQLT